MKLINQIVASSNLIALWFMYKYNCLDNTYIYFPMLASILYHLSETKHNLPGIYPFNLYTHQLLQLDRVFAVLSFIKCALTIYHNPEIIMINNYHLLILSIIAFICLMYSERDIIYTNVQYICNKNKTKNKNNNLLFKVHKMEFAITHCIWHVLAYYLLINIIISNPKQSIHVF